MRELRRDIHTSAAASSLLSWLLSLGRIFDRLGYSSHALAMPRCPGTKMSGVFNGLAASVGKTPAERIALAARLSATQYCLIRETLAADLDMRTDALDAAVADSHRAKANGHADAPVTPWSIPPVSTWAERPAPPRRDLICEGIALAAGRVGSLIGDGGFGKSTIAKQLAIACAATGTLWGMPVTRGPVLGVFCEDEQSEVERRVRLIAEAENVPLDLLDNLHVLSRDGEDTVLANFERDVINLTNAYWQLDATIASLKPRLTILDTAADIFAGDFISTPHVRQFIKIALGGLCKRHGTAILLLAHPSLSGMASGDGGGFSTAWNNSVRSRLYLRRPKSSDADAIADRRVLEVKKSNYGPTGAMIPLVYANGRFVLDLAPIEECAKPIRAPKTDTRLSLAIMAFMNAKAGSGQVVPFGAIFEALQRDGMIPKGDYQTVRKPLQRSLKDLIDANLLKPCDVPKGYRIAVAATP